MSRRILRVASNVSDDSEYCIMFIICCVWNELFCQEFLVAIDE